MKRLQLCLAAAFICFASMGQSTNDNSIAASGTEAISSFSFFAVTPQNGRVLLRWSAPQIRSEDFFIVEKSLDAFHFEMLGAMDASVGSDSVFSLVDNSISSGMVSYRIRIVGKDGLTVSSKMVKINTPLVADFKFYPNPVDKLLIVRSSHPLNIQVMDAYGVVWFTQDVEAGMQIVNVSALQKGKYILKATDKSSNMVISEQLVKNN